MRVERVGGDDWSEQVAQAAVEILQERQPYEPLADFLFTRISSEWLRARLLFIQRMRAGDRRETMSDPKHLIDALNRLHMLSSAAMWIYIKVQDIGEVYGTPEAVEFLRELIREDAQG